MVPISDIEDRLVLSTYCRKQVVRPVLNAMQRPVVLLVDDDPMMRELLSDVFQVHGGFRIGGVAQDGFEGAMLAADIHPDVVILDYFMPRWDGEKAAAFIRERCPSSKIVAFSAVLAEQPEWGDSFLVKNDIGRLIPAVEALLTMNENAATNGRGSTNGNGSAG